MIAKQVFSPIKQELILSLKDLVATGARLNIFEERSSTTKVVIC